MPYLCILVVLSDSPPSYEKLLGYHCHCFVIGSLLHAAHDRQAREEESNSIDGIKKKQLVVDGLVGLEGEAILLVADVRAYSSHLQNQPPCNKYGCPS